MIEAANEVPLKPIGFGFDYPSDCICEWLHDDGFKLTFLISSPSANFSVHVEYSGFPLAFRRGEETQYQRALHRTIGGPSVNVYQDTTSEYLRAFLADAYGTVDAAELMHVVYLTGTICIDVLSRQGPKITRVTVDTKYGSIT